VAAPWKDHDIDRQLVWQTFTDVNRASSVSEQAVADETSAQKRTDSEHGRHLLLKNGVT
jgi:hypothetical protein